MTCHVSLVFHLMMIMVFPGSSAQIMSTHFSGPENGRMSSRLSGQMISNFVGVSKIGCAQRCSVLPQCTAFNTGTGRRCELLGGYHQLFTRELVDGAKHFMVGILFL